MRQLGRTADHMTRPKGGGEGEGWHRGQDFLCIICGAVVYLDGPHTLSCQAECHR